MVTVDECGWEGVTDGVMASASVVVAARRRGVIFLKKKKTEI
jgi:hypothetical protein